MSISVTKIVPDNWNDYFSPDHSLLSAGLDVATTDKKKSNPNALSIIQQVGHAKILRFIIRFKTSDPAVVSNLLKTVIGGLPHGLRLKTLCIDASSEKFFAAIVKQELSGLCHVNLVSNSSKARYLGEDMNYKQYLGNLLVNSMSYLDLPDSNWLAKDIRQVVRINGTFDADIDENGNHADGFDSIKLALYGLESGSDCSDIIIGDAFGMNVHTYGNRNFYSGTRTYN